MSAGCPTDLIIHVTSESLEGLSKRFEKPMMRWHSLSSWIHRPPPDPCSAPFSTVPPEVRGFCSGQRLEPNPGLDAGLCSLAPAVASSRFLRDPKREVRSLTDFFAYLSARCMENSIGNSEELTVHFVWRNCAMADGTPKNRSYHLPTLHGNGWWSPHTRGVAPSNPGVSWGTDDCYVAWVLGRR